MSERVASQRMIGDPRPSRRIRVTAGIAARIVLAALVVSGVALAILALGVVIVGSERFNALMAQHGQSADASAAMFGESVLTVMAVAALVAVIVAAALAAIIAARLARPLRVIDAAARRVATGDYRARIEPAGPEEIAGLADSFNRMAAALEDQERMRREFIANAAHELRTPLTNLKGYLEGLRDGVIEPDPATYASLWEEVERLVRLARSLDTLASGDTASDSPVSDVDLSRAVRTASEFATPAALAAGLDLTVDVPAGLRVRADPDGVAQVLGNLFQNAVRYTPSGGAIDVTARSVASDVLVTVSNTGSGIPAEDLPHVFERFYRVEKSRDPATGGMGIGLAIVRQVVEAAGGTVGAESADGITRFWFRLPAR